MISITLDKAEPGKTFGTPFAASVAWSMSCGIHEGSNEICIKIPAFSGQLEGGPSGLILRDVRATISVEGEEYTPLTSTLNSSPGQPVISLPVQLDKINLEQRQKSSNLNFNPSLEGKIAAGEPSGKLSLLSFERQKEPEITDLAQKGSIQPVLFLKRSL